MRAAAISRTFERKLIRLDIDGQCVKVGEEEEAFGLVLHPHPAQDRAEQVAEVKAAGRLDSGNDADCGVWCVMLRGPRLESSFMSSSTNAPVTKQAMA